MQYKDTLSYQPSLQGRQRSVRLRCRTSAAAAAAAAAEVAVVAADRQEANMRAPS